MSDFFTMITSFGNSPCANAHLEVGLDSQAASAVDVTFNVYSQKGVELAWFSELKNANGYVSSSADPNNDLFRLSKGQPALVRARTPLVVQTASALLQQSGSQNRLVFAVPPALNSSGIRVAQGTVFPLTIGSITKGTLLIANVSDSDVNVDVFTGTAGTPGTGKYNNPILTKFSIWSVDLQPSDQFSHLVVMSSGDIIVQLVLDDGQVHVVTCLPNFYEK
ncbi:hypothetical protein CN540_16870 [Bacillus toyonensis]|uniref:hypothetical protein n=1 Tax=Bacillus toyonensis TaxID=155322 RepID=UPI000BF13333|nr:hypothetical protein [Bacillus toyonensis]PEN54692.1 hypothetical protein CN540_16870 [Bacillus toyonensis]PGE06645.1 hypothetical protein COM54_27635 [Bacillus toyonensis]PGE12881.1 hypothetical protein COM64_25810 [Bacillus toyonensis]